MNDIFNDPENIDEILKEISDAPTLKEVYSIVARIYPTWVVDKFPGYSKDYIFLEENWKLLCKKMGCEPQCILLVEYLNMEDPENQYRLIHIFAELLMRSGFIVRRREEFIPCKNCGYLIPQEPIYELFKKLGKKIPPRWTTQCTSC